jgi:hypothetical protein
MSHLAATPVRTADMLRVALATACLIRYELITHLLAYSVAVVADTPATSR